MNPAKSLVAYLRSSKAELEKVSWPTRRDVTRYSTLIVGVSLVAAAFFALLDAGLHAGVLKAISRRIPAQTAPVTQQIPAGSLQVTPEGGAPIEAAPAQGTAPVTTNVIDGSNPTAPAPTAAPAKP